MCCDSARLVPRITNTKENSWNTFYLIRLLLVDFNNVHLRIISSCHFQLSD